MSGSFPFQMMLISSLSLPPFSHISLHHFISQTFSVWKKKGRARKRERREMDCEKGRVRESNLDPDDDDGDHSLSFFLSLSLMKGHFIW